MGEVRHGKIHLRWCDQCNVPVLEQGSCGLCGGRTREVKITPPGDARPAFAHDITVIRRLIDQQFGEGTGLAVLPEGHIVILNKAPDIDRMDEVIVGGEVVGAMRFSLVDGERFLPRPASARILAPIARRGWVKIDPGAADAIRTKSASALAIGIEDCDPGITKGAEVIVLGLDGEAVSVGVTKMSAEEMLTHPRGTAVKTRWTVERGAAAPPRKAARWEDAVSASRETMNRRAVEARRFVADTVAQAGLPVVVSYSGGKDSLATLHLVLDAGIRPKLLFVDTGLEFDETLQNVREVAEEFGLELVSESAGDAFWKNVGFFGPPARDYRWCCKTCKLGPATRLIQRTFPEGVLSFIGQRAYESESRANKGRVWRNPWTPGQLAASPIQKWTALHVWIYLFSKGARHNPLYEKGFERIGCFMCPAADLAELRRARDICARYPRWQDILDRYAKARGKSEAWLAYDAWRWKRVPKSVIDELSQRGIDVSSAEPAQQETAPLEFRSTGGYSPCVEGLSMEGVFSRPLDMARVANLLNMQGKVTTSPDNQIAEVRGMTVFAEGPVMVRAKDEKELATRASRLREIVFRAMNCAGCGICVARCETGALSLDGRVSIDEGRCTHCGACFGPCPVVAFREDEMDI